MNIQPYLPEHYPALCELLSSYHLPLQGIQPTTPHFFVVLNGNDVVGCIGLEQYGRLALLRSVAVREQNAGLGTMLLQHIIHYARELNIQELYLLTTTAEQYFAGHGFEVVPYPLLPQALFASAELQGACPSTATAMKLSLTPQHTANL